MSRKEPLFMKRLSFDAGDIIFKKNDPRDYAYIIENGEVELSGGSIDGKNETVLTIGKGSIFGESALLEGGHRDATARTTRPTRVFCIAPDILKARMNQLDPMVKLLMSMLIEKYHNHRIANIHGDEGSGISHTAQELLVENYEKQRLNVLQELRMEQELRRGLEQEEFKPYLQPIVEFESGRILGYETLVRWHHAERGVLFPNDFIPIAERTNVVSDIDVSMLRAACKLIPQLHNIAGPYAKKMFISVNLSGANFNTTDIIEKVEDVLKDISFDPSQIKLEITESALVSDAEQAAYILDELKKLGVTIALDDFGTGYSSLGYLHKFTIDTLKIDRSFVQQLQISQKSMNIVKAVVDLAHTFELDLVAEGIEEPQEVEILKQLGCEYGQGYHFGRPMEATQCLNLFAQQFKTGSVVVLRPANDKESAE